MLSSRQAASIALAAIFVLTAVPSHGGALPTWDKRIDTSGRYKVLKKFNDEAVLDKETGLVWTRSAVLDFNDVPATTTWANAMFSCSARIFGGRRGWRLPSISELTSLLGSTSSLLQPGHPFLNVNDVDAYWSATTSAGDPTEAMTSRLASLNPVTTPPKVSEERYLCVRGPGGIDGGH